jgi:hypothetical protein
MESKELNITWGISLFVIGIATLVLAGSNIIGLELPDAAKIIIGIIDLIALPILVFTTVKKLKNKQ